GRPPSYGRRTGHSSHHGRRRGGGDRDDWGCDSECRGGGGQVFRTTSERRSVERLPGRRRLGHEAADCLRGEELQSGRQSAARVAGGKAWAGFHDKGWQTARGGEPGNDVQRG